MASIILIGLGALAFVLGYGILALILLVIGVVVAVLNR